MKIFPSYNKILTFLLLLILFPIGLLHYHEISAVKTQPFYNDYGTFYESLYWSKHNESLYKIYKIKITNKANPFMQSHFINHPTNLNPPFFSFLIYPLSYFSFSTSMLIWIFFSVLCGIFVILYSTKMLAVTKNKLLITLALLAALFAYYPTVINIQLGQLGLVLMPLVFFSWWGARNKQMRLCGLLLGFATSIKIFLGIFAIYFLMRREWRALKWFIGTILVCSLLPLTLFPFSEYAAYYKTLATHISWLTSSWNASLPGFLIRVFGGNQEINTPLIHLPTLSYMLRWLLSGILLITFIKCLLSNAKIDPQTKCDLDFSLTLTLMLLISPLGWIYYFPLLFIPCITLFRIADQGYQTLTLRLLTCLVIILTSVPYPLILPKHIIGASTIFLNAGVYFYALLLLCSLLFFAHYILKQQSRSTAPDISQNLVVSLYVMAFLPSFIGVLGIFTNFTANKAFFMPIIEMLTS